MKYDLLAQLFKRIPRHTRQCFVSGMSAMVTDLKDLSPIFICWQTS